MNFWFFMRHGNDIDNIAPAIYFLLYRNESARATIILYHEDFDNREDVNLVMLVKEFGARVSIFHIVELFGIKQGRGEGPRRAASWMRRGAQKLGGRLPRLRQLLERGLQTSIAMIRRLVFGGSAKPLDVASIRRGFVPASVMDAALFSLAEKVGQPQLAVFDINRSSEVIGLVFGLRRMGVTRVICLPVSPLISTNALRDHKHVRVFEPWFRNSHDYSIFDVVGFVDETYPKSYARVMGLLGLPDDLQGKVKRLGSIRYCRAWMQERDRLLGFQSEAPGSQRRGNEHHTNVDILFLLSNSSSNVDVAELQRTLEFIGQCPGYRVTVKGHTRKDDLSRAHAGATLRFDSNTSTSALIRAADLIIFWSTSAAIEGYARGKFMVCLPYLSCNDNLYADFDAGYIAHTRDDLLEVLVRFPSERHLLKYNVDGVRRFVDEVVEYGSSGQTVPARYVEFLVEEARKGGATST